MKQPRQAAAAIYGITWLNREEWQKMRAVAADPYTLMPTYEDWVLMTGRAVKDMEQSGKHVKKVPVSADDFAAWCAGSGRYADSAARSEYVSFIMATERALRQTRKQRKTDDE